MSKSLTTKTYPLLGIVIAVLAVLIVSGLDAASLIATELRASVTNVAGFFSLILLIFMIKQV